MIQRSILIPFFLFPLFGYAGEGGGSTGFDILRQPVGGRPAAMGGAFTAVSGDLYGLAFNPAGLADVKDREVALTYVDRFMDIKSGFIGYGQALGAGGRIGFSVAYTNYGEMRRTDVTGNDQGGFTPGDFVVTAGYASRLTMGLRYGIALKYVYSKIDQYAAGAVAADIGILYPVENQNASIGLSILNVGASTDAFVEAKEKLPLAYRLGASTRLAHLPLLLSFHLIRYHYEESDLFLGLYWALGGEFTITEHFFLRWGYNSRGSEEKTGANEDRFAGVSLGLGFRFRDMRLDVGMGSHGALGMMSHFSFLMPL